MKHLMERYRKIRASDLESYRQALVAPIEVDLPTNVYFQPVEETIKFT